MGCKFEQASFTNLLRHPVWGLLFKIIFNVLYKGCIICSLRRLGSKYACKGTSLMGCIKPWNMFLLGSLSLSLLCWLDPHSRVISYTYWYKSSFIVLQKSITGFWLKVHFKRKDVNVVLPLIYQFLFSKISFMCNNLDATFFLRITFHPYGIFVEFSEALRDMGTCLLEQTALNDDEESGECIYISFPITSGA